MARSVIRRFPVEESLEAELRAGAEALVHLGWAEARLRFRAALDREETPEALEGLAMAISCLGDVDESFPLRERAFALYRRRGDRRGAARLAILLGITTIGLRGEDAVASGWLGRARRLLDGLEPGPEQAWLALWEAHVAFLHHDDLETALERLERGSELARAAG
jgi:hypothetical protein